ncbi:MAG: penicillin-binding transpeptidase domain-containing protein [Christensenella sp.]|uniref:penicillin-binding transpeptidase domain-containing protein n=1 Tax=Christensenella sp. TaxID=1935934 RepID=UPI002B203D6A|nr:penicillin-binding transpeptidase domain-containing protein [Christensenella sp.]MEA5002362.1 penicillin-binding transpeptidase domain-containing protein [Christensenella sp.]
MLKKLKNRFLISFTVIALVFVMLMVGLGNLTLVQGGTLATQSEDKKIRTLQLKGARGQITDSTGIPLAYDQSSYDIQFTKDPSKNTTTDKAYYTDVLIRAIALIEENGGSTIDTFSIKRGDDGTFAFDFGVTDEDAFAKREEDWRKNMFVSKSETVTPDVIYRDLRSRYRIPEEYTYEQARKLLSIWQEVQLSSYVAYVPVTICKNVDMNLVSVLEGHSDDLEGIQIAESATRIYPKDDVMAVLLGYMGKMNDKDTVTEYKAKGYSPDDLIGTTGLESTMEQYLTGNSTEKQGTRQVEVNSKGKVIQELAYTPPKQGYDVRLTVDLQLQMAAEKAIKENVEQVYQKQYDMYYNPTTEEQIKKRESYDVELDKRTLTDEQIADGKSTNFDKLSLAKSGALIVMDVKTGNVLAMANYPSYDANLFTSGISEAAMQELSNDPGTPLFNKAISSKVIPGSIFKMVTGMGGLMEGAITLDTHIDCEKEYKKYVSENYVGHVPSCWINPYNLQKHAGLDLEYALAQSCNYFFYTVADNMGIDNVVKWGENFGLTKPTNIELTGEAVGQIGNQDVLYDPEKPLEQQKTSLPRLVRAQIMGYLEDYGVKLGVTYTDEQITKTTDRLIALVAPVLLQPGNLTLGEQITTVLFEELDITARTSRNRGWHNDINQSLQQLKWNPNETITAGIGTNFTTITPIAVARYVSSLVNGGIVYNANIVDNVVDQDGNVIEKVEPVVYNKIEAPEEYFSTIKQGMKDVVSDDEFGGARDAFKNEDGTDWKYLKMIGGKTGTGQVSEVELENNAWFVAFAPYDDPEIAVVSYIPNGYSGASAAPAARSIIEYYLDGKETEGTPKTESVPSSNQIVL